MMDKHEENPVVGALFIGVILMGVSGVVILDHYVLKPRREARRIIRTQHKIVYSVADDYLSDVLDQGTLNPETVDTGDYWGNPIRVSALKIDEGVQVVAESAGPDGVFNTEDDIVEGVKYVDRAKKAGKAVGRGIKGIAKGLVEKTQLERVLE